MGSNLVGIHRHEDYNGWFDKAVVARRRSAGNAFRTAA